MAFTPTREHDWEKNRELAELGKSFREIERVTGTAFCTVARKARKERWKIPVWLRNAFFHLRTLETCRGVPCYLDGGGFGAALREQITSVGKKLELIPDIECDILLKRIIWSKPSVELLEYLATEDIQNKFQQVAAELEGAIGEDFKDHGQRNSESPLKTATKQELAAQGSSAPDSGLVSPGLSGGQRFIADRRRMAKKVSRKLRKAADNLPEVESWRDVKLMLEVHRELFGVAPLASHPAPDTPLNVDGLGKVARAKQVREQE